MNDAKKCPKCGKPYAYAPVDSGPDVPCGASSWSCLERQLAQAVERAERAEARANGTEAANEHLHNRIGKLKAEAKRLREALERIARCKDNPDPMGYLPAIAAEALATKEGER